MADRVIHPSKNTTYNTASDVPLEADDFPILVRIPCDVEGCKRESWTSIPIPAVHGRITLCSTHRSRLQLVLLRFLGLPDAAERWEAYDASLWREAINGGQAHSSGIAKASVPPYVVCHPHDWLCSLCGHGMSFQSGVSFGMHKCSEDLRP